MQSRPLPKGGWSILLFENAEGHRTYSDCADSDDGIERLLDIFESFRREQGLDDQKYILDDIKAWLSSFHDIQMMIFDKEINRYKRVDADGLKKLLEDQVRQSMAEVEE